MKKINYAIIGCGRISPFHIEAAKNNNLHIAALCDSDREAAVSIANRFDLNSAKIYTDYAKMLENEQLDLVAIATESGKHASIAQDCIREKIHVIIEKPIALSITDARQIISLAKENNVLVSTCHQNRFNKSVQKVYESIKNGQLGKLMYSTANIRWNRNKGYFDQAKWRGTWAQDGGTLMNQCIHNIDLLLWLMQDEVSEVFAYTDKLLHPYIEAEDIGLALIKFKNSGYGVLEGTTNIYPTNFEETLALFGEKGTVRIGGKSVNTITDWLVEGSNETVDDIKTKFSEHPESVYGFGHSPLYKDMIDAICEGREPYINGEAGMKAMELVLAIYKSSASGLPVKLPLDECSTLDFEGEMKWSLGI